MEEDEADSVTDHEFGQNLDKTHEFGGSEWWKALHTVIHVYRLND